MYTKIDTWPWRLLTGLGREHSAGREEEPFSIQACRHACMICLCTRKTVRSILRLLYPRSTLVGPTDWKLSWISVVLFHPGEAFNICREREREKKESATRSCSSLYTQEVSVDGLCTAVEDTARGSTAEEEEGSQYGSIEGSAVQRRLWEKVGISSREACLRHLRRTRRSVSFICVAFVSS